MDLNNSPLGKKTDYATSSEYNPRLLFPIARSFKRDELGIDSQKLPFYGVDIWNHYEVSWLNPQGLPRVAIAVIEVPAMSEFIIESKTLKLYFNSLNNHRFADTKALHGTIVNDLSGAVGMTVVVKILPLDNNEITIHKVTGICVDNIDVAINEYTVNPGLLKSDKEIQLTETIYSHLLRSNCLITNQPDWATIIVSYTGKQIDHESFLKYIVSFRNHNEFSEQCVERVFMHLSKQGNFTELTVTGRFTRRGGIDINSIRSTNKDVARENLRLMRQ